MSEILKEVALGIMFATPLGLAMVIGLMWLIREAFRWLKMRRLLKAWGGRILRSAQNDRTGDARAADDRPYDGEEAVYL